MSISIRRLLCGALLLLLGAHAMPAQTAKPQSGKMQPDTATRVEIYGFAQADAVFDFKRINPDWFDVNRPSRLPSSEGEFGNDNRFAVSPRQSRLGVKANIPTGGTPIKIVWDFDLFGVGVDAGQTTI